MTDDSFDPDFDDDDFAYGAIEAAVLEAVTDGPLPMDEVVRRLDERGLLEVLREDGWEDGELGDGIRHVTDTDAIWFSAGGVVAASDHLLDGAVFTHRLTAGERARGAVAVDPDLVILDFNRRDGLDLEGGGRLEWCIGGLPGPSEYVGPDGWLDGFTAGDLLAFERKGSTVRVRRVDEVADGSEEVKHLADAAHGWVPEARGEEAVPIVLDALTASPGLFRRPVPPVSELLADAGLEQRGHEFGWAGTEWSTHAERAHERTRDSVARRYGLDRCCVRALEQVEAALAEFQRSGAAVPGDDAAVIAEALRHGDVAAAFVELVGSGRRPLIPDRTRDERVRSFATAVADRLPPRKAVPARFVAALASLVMGEALDAHATLRAIVRDDPSFGPALLAVAGLELDRGDLDRAIALFRHPEVGQPDGAALVEEFRAEAVGPRVGRNDRCPCGSGRKFKQCCERDPKVPLTRRLGLLMLKLFRYVATTDLRSALVGVASSAVDPDDPDIVSSMRALIDDPAIVDFFLFEGGAAEAYLAERGPLLLADEAELLGRLLAEPRRLWEVVAVARGESLDLRDTKTGELVVVTERTASLDREPGDLLLARVAHDLPAAGGLEAQLVGTPILVPLHARQSAIELVDSHPDADRLASWYGALTGPPRLSNREGEPLVLCRVVLTFAPGTDVEAVAAALDERLDRDDPDAFAWVERFTLPEGETVLRGRVSFTDGAAGLEVETNSEERLERLLAVVCQAAPGCEVVDDERRDARRLMLEPRDADVDDDLDVLDDPASEELEAALDEYIRERERAWVDEPVPALGGLTPRQALDDPTRREDLLALLRDFERRSVPAPGGRGFDAGRIRELLGLA